MIIIYQKETLKLSMEIVDCKDVPYDLTNAEVRFRLRDKKDSGKSPLYELLCVNSLPNTAIAYLQEIHTDYPPGYYTQEWRVFDHVTGDSMTVYQQDLVIRESQFDEGL